MSSDSYKIANQKQIQYCKTQILRKNYLFMKWTKLCINNTKFLTLFYPSSKPPFWLAYHFIVNLALVNLTEEFENFAVVTGRFWEKVRSTDASEARIEINLSANRAVKNKCNFCHFDKKYCYSCHVFAAHFCRRCRQPVFLNGLHQKIEYLFVIYRLPYFPAKVSGKNVTLDNRSNLIYVQ